MTLTLLFLGTMAWAGDFSEIFQARNIEELRAAVAASETQEEGFNGCQLERRLQKFPAHCIDELEDNVLLVGNGESWRRSWQDLSLLCERSASQLVDRLEIARFLKVEELSGACRRALRERAADLEYIDKR